MILDQSGRNENQSILTSFAQNQNSSVTGTVSERNDVPALMSISSSTVPTQSTSSTNYTSNGIPVHTSISGTTISVPTNYIPIPKKRQKFFTTTNASNVPSPNGTQVVPIIPIDRAVSKAAKKFFHKDEQCWLKDFSNNCLVAATILEQHTHNKYLICINATKQILLRKVYFLEKMVVA